MNPRVRRLRRFLWTRLSFHRAARSFRPIPPLPSVGSMAAVLLILLLGVGLAAALVWLARTLRELRADWSTQLSDRNAEVDRHLDRGDRDDGPAARRARHEGRPPTRERIADDEQDPRAARQGGQATTQMLERAKDLARLEQALRPRRPAAASASSCSRTCSATGCRLRPTRCSTASRAASASTPSCESTGSIPVDSKFPLDNYSRLVEAETDDERQLQRGSSRGTSSSTSTRSRPSTSGRTRAPTTSPSCTSPSKAVYYELACGKTGALLAVRARAARLPRVADDVHRVPAGDRARAAGHADRGACTRGDGVRRRSPPRLRPVRRGLRQGRHAPRPRAVEVHEAGKRLDKFGTKLERAVEEQGEIEGETCSSFPASRPTPRS